MSVNDISPYLKNLKIKHFPNIKSDILTYQVINLGTQEKLLHGSFTVAQLF